MNENEQIIKCHFPSEHSLFVSYMPFIKDGGLFVHSKNVFELGDHVTLSLTFLNETDEYIVEGQVVWVTPKGAQGNKPAGIGVQFLSDNKRQVCNIIETYLAGKLKSAQVTDTM